MKKLLLTLALLASSQSFARNINLTVGESAYLPDCGGTIAVSTDNINGEERVIMNLNGIQNCQIFDLLKANGEYLPNYRARTIGMHKRDGRLIFNNGSSEYSRSSEYRIVESLRVYGFNNFKAVIYDTNGNSRDTVTIRYVDLQSNLPSTPAPSYPQRRPSQPVIIIQPSPSSSSTDY